ncbi:MAG: metallophosphoesterase family protein [Candidatus Eisenbacteria bacterium]|nr:metallophosphoesterase family protein [Candidatus Eisenbacteria bacterium]
MRFAIISDIHANLEALQAVLKKIESLGADKLVCLGDTVGYGANPNECTELVREKAQVVLCGNHDHAAVGGTSIEFFNSYARAAILWTMGVLKPDCKEFLKGLPLTGSIDGAFLVHATPSEPAQWNYVFEPHEAAGEFDAFQEQVCFIGHSHFALFFTKEGATCKVTLPGDFSLAKDARYLVNVGSVGQPRDGFNTACFVTYDMPEGVVQFHRVEYDLSLAYQKIIKARLPRFLAERLLIGE